MKNLPKERTELTKEEEEEIQYQKQMTSFKKCLDDYENIENREQE